MITTTEEIQALFNQMAAQKHAAGLSKQQAEAVACKQLVKDAQKGEIEEKALRAFIKAFEIAKGSTPEIAEVLLENLFGGKTPTFVERDRGFTQAGNKAGESTAPSV